MELDDYQKTAATFDLFESSDMLNLAFLDKVLGLVGESGEVADKVKKLIRDEQGLISEEAKNELKLELGDVFWYLASVSRYLGLSLEEVAAANLTKLESRKSRGKISGNGDNR